MFLQQKQNHFLLYIFENAVVIIDDVADVIVISVLTQYHSIRKYYIFQLKQSHLLLYPFKILLLVFLLLWMMLFLLLWFMFLLLLVLLLSLLLQQLSYRIDRKEKLLFSFQVSVLIRHLKSRYRATTEVGNPCFRWSGLYLVSGATI